MRIIAGNLRGKKLSSLPGASIRPTADRVRESIFNICASGIDDAVVLDLFAGTGAFAIEALSRGARFAVLIDSSVRSVSVIRKNIEACRMQDQVNILRWNITNNLNCLRNIPLKFDLVFMDPPYNKAAIRPALKNLAACGALTESATVIVEHSLTEPIPGDLSDFELTDQRKYGKTLVSFLNYV